MQDVKKSSKRHGQHTSALMERTKGMLTNGATLLSFAEETLADIAAVLIPATVDDCATVDSGILQRQGALQVHQP